MQEYVIIHLERSDMTPNRLTGSAARQIRHIQPL